jgi:hypothetical protein
MKYAVAWISFFSNELQIIAVDAYDPITAMIEGVRQLAGNDPENNEWLDNMLKDIPEEGYTARIEEIREEFFNVDQAVTVMLPSTGETYR